MMQSFWTNFLSIFIPYFLHPAVFFATKQTNHLQGLPSSSSSSSSSTTAHKTRYNRLNGPPPKSQSQPANLTSLQNYSSSNESLADEEMGGAVGRGRPLPLLEESRGENHNDLVDLNLESQYTPADPSAEEKNRKKEKWPSGLNSTKKNGGGGGMKHSLSSFFPFTSCATTASSPPPQQPAASSTSFTSLALKQSPQTGSSTISPMTGGNDTTEVMEGASSWDHVKKEMGSGVYSCENDAEEDISDLGMFPFIFLFYFLERSQRK